VGGATRPSALPSITSAVFNQASGIPARASVAVFDPAGQFGQDPATWYVRHCNAPGAPDVAPFASGARDHIPLSGGWDGDGVATIGVFDPFAQFGRPPVPRPDRRRARVGPPRAAL
jgi:hypothetical protein